MTNIDLYPLQDNYESKLSQPYDGTSSVIYVDTVPTATLPSGAKVLFTINPGTSFAQTVEVNGWSTGQLNVSSTTVEKGNGINYSTTSHGAKSPIIISDNFAYWKEIATNVSTKADTASPVFTGSVGLPKYDNTGARDSAIPSPTGKELVIVNGDIQHYNSVTAQRETADTGTPTPNASTTLAGKVEKATPTEITNGTSTGGTGAELFVGPADLKTVTDAINSKIAFTFGGDSSDGVIDGTANLTLTGSNDTYIVKNYSSWAAGTASRVCTVTPTGCVTHIKIKGNADFTNRSFNFNGKGALGGVGGNNGSGFNSAGTAGSSFTTILMNNPVTGGGGGPIGSNGGGGGGGSGTNGTQATNSGGATIAAGGVTNLLRSLSTTLVGRRIVEISGGAGGGGGGETANGIGGDGGNGGGALIIEVGGNITGAPTTINVSGTNGGNSTLDGGGGGGGGGGTALVMYGGTISGTITPVVTGGTGGAGANGGFSGASGGTGDFLVIKNNMF